MRVLQEPGNILFLNNHYLIHARSTYVDHEKPSEQRHLRRLWLESEAWSDARPQAMKTLLDNVWNTGVGIEMWDDEDAAA